MEGLCRFVIPAAALPTQEVYLLQLPYMEYNLLVLAPWLRAQWLCGPLGLHCGLLGDLSFPCPSEQGEVLVERQLHL